jgi:hypothetical protein
MANAESTNTSPIYFIFLPSSSPVSDVESLAQKLSFDPKKMLEQVVIVQGKDVRIWKLVQIHVFLKFMFKYH